MEAWGQKQVNLYMKRILTILCIFGMSIILSQTSVAQEYKYDAKLGWFPADLFSLIYIMGESLDASYGPMKTVGIFSADFDFRMKKWLSVGAKVNYRNSWRDMITAEGTGIDRMQTLSVMPTVKFTTGFEYIFRYYAMIGLGAGADLSTDSQRYFTAYQFTPVGIALGKKVSWFLELSLGNAYTGYMTGISWRF